MNEEHPGFEPFDALIGVWDTEATHPLFDGVVSGTISFEWLEDGHYLIQRSAPTPTTLAPATGGPAPANALHRAPVQGV